MTVLAIDPGSDKCGLAVTAQNGQILHQRIAARRDIVGQLSQLIEAHKVDAIILGHATTSRGLKEELAGVSGDLEVILVDETGSTLEARALYWQKNRRRGWRRLVPLALQVPPEPIDDFAAIVLAQRFFSTR